MLTASLFHRSPRTLPVPPAEEVEIQAPPPAPARPTSSLVAVLAPLGMTVLAFGLSVAFAATNPTYLLFSLPMMVGSGLLSLITYTGERNKYRRAVEERERRYRQYLAQQQQSLQALADRQRQAALEPNTDPSYVGAYNRSADVHCTPAPDCNDAPTGDCHADCHSGTDEDVHSYPNADAPGDRELLGEVGFRWLWRWAVPRAL